MYKEALEAHLGAIGWKKDSRGHFHKEVTCRQKLTGALVTRECRVKIQERSCRIELAYRDPDDTKQWLRIGGGYYKHFVKLPDGRLRIGSYFFPARDDVRPALV